MIICNLLTIVFFLFLLNYWYELFPDNEENKHKFFHDFIMNCFIPYIFYKERLYIFIPYIFQIYLFFAKILNHYNVLLKI